MDVDQATLRMSRWMLVLLAAGSVLLATLRGGYFPVTSGATALALLLALLGLVVAGIVPIVRMPARSIVGLAAMAVLLAWTTSAIGWAEDRHAAIEEAVRTCLNAAAVSLGALLAVRRASAYALLVTAALVPGGVAILELARAPSSLAGAFDDGQLAGHLGYHNGTASLLTAPFWAAMVLAAARGTRWWVSLPLVFASTMAAQLATMTQSRAMALTIVATALLVLALAPHRRRTLLLGVAALAGVAVNWHALNAPYASGAEAVPPEALDGLALRIASGTIPALLACVFLLLVPERRPRCHVRARPPRVFVASTAVALVVAIVVVGVVAQPRTDGVLGDAWASFNSAPSDERTHGSRYELASNNGRLVMWGVALKAFRAHPVEGVGGGNWEAWYYRYRTRDAGFARQPHGLTFELLAERGIVGMGCFALVLGLAFAPVVRARAIGASVQDRTCMVAAACIVCAWLLQAQVDWLWQLPATTMLPMLAIGALLVAPWNSPARQRPRLAARGAGALTVASLAALVAVPTIAARHVQLAAADPASAARHLAIADGMLPVSWRLASDRAELAAQSGDRDRAAALSRAAIRRAPSYYAPYERAAAVSRQLGDDARADAYERRARSLFRE